jgi:hypothetical protein
MRPVGIIADVHVHNHTAFGGVVVGRRNERCTAIEACLRTVMDMTRDFGLLAIAGDLFDNDRPPPDHIHAVGDLLRGGCRKALAVGNHDQHSTSPNDHALAPLGLVDGVTVYDTPGAVHVDAETAVDILPFWVDVLHHIPRGRIVVAHHGIADEKTPPFLRHGKGVVQTSDLFTWMNMHGVDYYIAGDWHEHKHWEKGGKHIIQVGALVPTGWNNPGHYGYGSLIVIDDDGWRRVVIPGPRFLYCASEEDVVKDARRAKKRGDVPYVKAACPAFEHPDIEGCHIEWAPVIAKAAGAVRVAADHLRSASTLDECLSGYVAASEGIPSEMKDDVLAKLKELMAA